MRVWGMFKPAAGAVCGTLIMKSIPPPICFDKDQTQLWWVGQRKASINASLRKLKNVSDFWKQVGRGQLTNQSLIKIQGQLSTYAPLLVGAPWKKRERHLSYRKRLQENKIDQSERAELNAYLAYTAGQMVWRLNLRNSPFVYLGLYHSIVRNAIPVFVESTYFQDHVEAVFRKGKNTNLIEAEIEAQVVNLTKPMEGIPQDLFKGYMQAWMSEIEGSTWGIAVDGKNTYIKFVDEARYLDGDIWVAIEDNGVQSFETRFVDFADLDDFNQEKTKLKKDLEMRVGFDSRKVVFQFDQVDKLFPQASELENLCESQISKKASDRKNPPF